MNRSTVLPTPSPQDRKATKLVSDIKSVVAEIEKEVAELEKKLDPIMGDRSYTMLANLVNFQSDKDSPLSRDLLTLHDRVHKIRALISNITTSIQL